MDIQKFGVQLGRNRWSNHQVFELLANLAELEGRALGDLPGFQEQILQHLPEPDAYVPARGDVSLRLALLRDLSQPAISLPEHLSRIVLGLGGCESTFGKTLTDPSGGYRLILGFQDEAFDRGCIEQVFERLNWLLEDRDPEIPGWLESLMGEADVARLGPSSLAIIQALQGQGVPFRRLNNGSLIQLGWGSRQRRLWTAQTDRTTAIASDISSDKELTRRLLHASGVPVPHGRIVESPDLAWATALEVGLPVVVKPRDSNHGQGVAIGLTTREQVEVAYLLASQIRPGETTDVIVERFIPGFEHRALVVGGQLVAAYRGQPAQVVGDGRHTIQELIDQINKDPRRGSGWHFPLDLMEISPMSKLLLEEQGYTSQSVPELGRTVDLSRNADMTVDVTDEVHPEVTARVIEAAKVVGLDIAGIDLVTPDIARPLEEMGGAIVEVNAGPGLMYHLHPAVGKPRPVGKAIASLLFERGDRGRIPLVAVYAHTQERCELLVQKLVQAIQAPGCSTGVIGRSGTFFNSRRIAAAGQPLSQSFQELITSPLLDLVILAVDPEDIHDHGLGFDEASYVVIADGQPDEQNVAGNEAITLLLESLLPHGGSVIAHRGQATAQTWADREGLNVIWADTGGQPLSDPALEGSVPGVVRVEDRLVRTILGVLRAPVSG